ncbi:hypothetical protein A2U01_0064014, partial [Trifolium medium]|nr:hypothetical protein [Trifolium medium]
VVVNIEALPPAVVPVTGALPYSAASCWKIPYYGGVPPCRRRRSDIDWGLPTLTITLII